METKRIYIKDTEHVRDEELLEAAEIIRRGGLVAFSYGNLYTDWEEMLWMRMLQKRFMQPRAGLLTIL